MLPPGTSGTGSCRASEGCVPPCDGAGHRRLQCGGPEAPVHPHGDHAAGRATGIRHIHPSGLTREIGGKICEPIERLVCDVPDGTIGAVIEDRPAERRSRHHVPVGSRYRLGIQLPSRGLFGYRNEFLTDTQGRGHHVLRLDSYAPMKGEIARRLTGSHVVSFETGEANSTVCSTPREQGVLFIGPSTEVYAGMVVVSAAGTRT